MRAGPRAGVARVVFATLLLVTTAMLLVPGEDLSSNAPNDKVSHLLTFTVLALSGRWARVRSLPLAAGLTAYAAVTELLQAVLPVNRHGDPRDLAADVLGVLAGLAVSWLLGRIPLRVRAAGPAGRSPSRPRG